MLASSSDVGTGYDQCADLDRVPARGRMGVFPKMGKVAVFVCVLLSGCAGLSAQQRATLQCMATDPGLAELVQDPYEALRLVEELRMDMDSIRSRVEDRSVPSDSDIDSLRMSAELALRLLACVERPTEALD